MAETVCYFKLTYGGHLKKQDGYEVMNRKLKAEINGTNSERIKYVKRQQYKKNVKDVKRMARSDKMEIVNNMAEEAEKAAHKSHANSLIELLRAVM